MKTNQPLLDYLATCSETSLQAFELARLNETADLRQHLVQQICGIVDELVEADTQARLARWIGDQRRPAVDRSSHCAHRRGEARLSRAIRETQRTLFSLPPAIAQSSEGPPRKSKRLVRLLRVRRCPGIVRKSRQMMFATAS